MGRVGGVLFIGLLTIVAAVRGAEAGSALVACERFANRQGTGADPDAPSLRLRRDARSTGDARIGRRRVVMVVTGTADRGDGNGMRSRFVCLLESDDRAIFFHLFPADVAGDNPIAECAANVQRQTDVGGCLDGRLVVAEREMEQALATARARLADLENTTGRAVPSDTVDASQSVWIAYRTRECARRAAERVPGAGARNVERACAVTLTLTRTRELLRP